MPAVLPKIRVGQPLRHEALSVFPLFSETASTVEYRLSDVALADESLLVEEVDESGSVPDLLVENKGDERVLFLEGEELVGAKQNRILNTSVLVAAHSKIKIPVSCVEQGRWNYKSRYFASSGSHSPSSLRRSLKASVTQSVKERRGHASDQSAVWQSVACTQALLAVDSTTSAMSDTFDTHRASIDEYTEALKYVDGATGVAFAVGERVVCLDLFDQAATCQKVWKRLLSGIVFDAMQADKPERHATLEQVEQLLTTTKDLPWEKAAAVGEGDEYRAESTQGDHASTLSFEETVVHGSVMAAM